MKVVYSLMFWCCASVAFGQVDYDRIIVPDHIKNTQIEERLVQLAWKNYPQNKIAEIEQTRAETQLTKANWNWMNRVTVSGNLNEFTINPESNQRAQFYPRYNFNLSIPLGIFADQATDSKIARTNLEIETEQIKQLKLSVRTEVLTRYEDLKRTNEILKEKNDYKQTLERRLIVATNGNAEQYEIDRLTDLLAQSRQDVILWTSNSKLAKLRIEELIGIRLEEVIVP